CYAGDGNGCNEHGCQAHGKRQRHVRGKRLARARRHMAGYHLCPEKRSSDRYKAVACESDRRHVMLSRIIDVCARNRFMVFTAVLLLTLAGIWSLQHVPLDALPDISDVQVIIHTSWAGEPPDVIEDQVTYPIVTSLLAAPHVKAVRAQTMFGDSYVYVVFQE